MSRALAIVLEGYPVGTMEMLRGGQEQITYDAKYAKLADATPLSVSMPLPQLQWRGRVVGNWLQNLLPDNDRVLTRWAVQFETSTKPYKLLHHVGRDVAGAVQFVDPDQLEDLTEGGVTWLDSRQLSARLAELRADPAAWTPQMAAGLFSLAGAQAKVALRYDEEADRWGLPYGAEPTTHILKPYSGDLPHQALNEHLTLTLADAVGLTAAHSRILTVDGHPVICVARYDRFTEDGVVRRVHQEDMCQALGLPPARKYETDGGPGIVAIVGLLRRTMGPVEFNRDVDRFLRAQAFACGTAATDAHAKNYGLLLAGKQVALTPLYDVHSAAPYFTTERRSVQPGRISVHRAGLAMRIGGARLFDEVDRDQWKALAGAARVDENRVLELVAEVYQSIPDAAQQLASRAAPDRRWTVDETAFIDTYVTEVTRRANNAMSALRGRGPKKRARSRQRQEAAAVEHQSGR